MDNIVRILRGGKTQAELAKLAGISQQTIAVYELGRFPSPEKLDRIAAAVGKRVVWEIKDRETNELSETPWRADETE